MARYIAVLTILFLSFVSTSTVAAQIGEKAPDFVAKGSDGKDYKLGSFSQKVVVLEWFNPECPFIKKHYESGNMQKLQQAYTDKGVIWLSVASSAKGKEGHMTDIQARDRAKAWQTHPTAVLLDETGVIGKAYGAKTTPHMFIIDKDGKLAYEGAIDSIPSADKADIAKAENYVSAALDTLLDGKPVSKPVTQAYGCSVKY